MARGRRRTRCAARSKPLSGPAGDFVHKVVLAYRRALPSQTGNHNQREQRIKAGMQRAAVAAVAAGTAITEAGLPVHRHLVGRRGPRRVPERRQLRGLPRLRQRCPVGQQHPVAQRQLRRHQLQRRHLGRQHADQRLVLTRAGYYPCSGWMSCRSGVAAGPVVSGRSDVRSRCLPGSEQDQWNGTSGRDHLSGNGSRSFSQDTRCTAVTS